VQNIASHAYWLTPWIKPTYSFSSSDSTTTDTDEAAIAADAIHGCSAKPSGLNTPNRQSDQHHIHLQFTFTFH